VNRPNFFIVGAPKSGTTALAQYLDQHPSIFFCPQKEPNYFCRDFPGIRLVSTEEEYLRLFQGATAQHRALGEGSIRYMYSKVAIEALHAFAPGAKLIIMLRNPVDMIHSFHSQALYALYESEKNIEKAWALQHERANGASVPKGCLEPAFLQYREVGMLGQQVERVLKIFPREQVRVYFMDDFARDTRSVYEEVLSFLDVPSDHRTDFPKVNENKRLKSSLIATVTQRPPKAWVKARKAIHRALGIESLGLLEPLRRWNKQTEDRQPMTPELRAMLTEEFRPDIESLAKLLDKNLDAWLQPLEPSQGSRLSAEN
jgi:hypothetical protein